MLDSISELYQTLVTAFVFAVPIIIALVNAIKEIFGLDGKVNMLVSFLVGVVLSGLFGLTYIWPGLEIYVVLIFFVLASGLVASGFYSFTTRVRDGE